MDSCYLNVIVGVEIKKSEIKKIKLEKLDALIELWKSKGYISGKEVPTAKMLKDYWLAAADGNEVDCDDDLDAESVFFDGEFFSHDDFEDKLNVNRIAKVCINVWPRNPLIVQECDDGVRKPCIGLRILSTNIVEGVDFDNNLSTYDGVALVEQLTLIGIHAFPIQTWLAVDMAYT